MNKIKVVDAFLSFGNLYKNGDILKADYFTEEGCWAKNDLENNLFLLKHEYEIMEEEK